MQIHELNNYVGSFDENAKIAVDNGTDTGKVSIPQLLADVNDEIDRAESALNARIDNIIAGGAAPSEAEIIDARLGAAVLGSKAYASLGDAIRGQATELKNAVSSLDSETRKNFGSVLLEGKTYDGNISYKRGSVNLSDGSYDDGLTDLQYFMVDSDYQPILLKSNTIVLHVKAGYKVRGVILNPDKTYATYFPTYSTGGSVSALQNRKGFYAILLAARTDGEMLTDSEVESAGFDLFYLESDLEIENGVLGNLEQLNNDSELWGKTYSYLTGTENVKDIADILEDKYVTPTTGVVSSNVNTYNLASLPLANVNRIFIAYTLSALLSYEGIAFYDSNGRFISGYEPELSDQSEKVTYNGYSGTFYVVPNNAALALINMNKGRDAIRYLVADVTNFKVFLGVTIPDYIGDTGRLFAGKKIVNFGDSIFGNYRDQNETTDKSISKMIAEALGASTYNAGFGGCRMAHHSSYWDAFCMHSLADSISSGDWSTQDAALIAGSGDLPDYFTNTVQMLKAIDWNEIDYITIGYGTNDYSGNIYITGTEEGVVFNEEYEYFSGALRYSLRNILQTYPHIRIAVISPCWRYFLENGSYAYSSDDPRSANTRGYILPDYVEACKDVCDEYHIPYIDTYSTLGFNEYSRTEYFYPSDGTHPLQPGRQLRADRISGQMLALFCH